MDAQVVTEAVRVPLRRPPTQQRARDRVQRILDGADRLLADEGVEALGTKQVASVAGISIGSLYFWFPDKESIAEALARRYWDELTELVTGVAQAAEAGEIADPSAEVLAALAAGFRARPGFLALWFDGLRSERLREATRPYRAQVAGSVQRILAATEPHANPETSREVAGMVVLLGDAILREAFRLDRSGEQTVLAEGARVLRAYIDDRLKEGA
jgi:AcrR family transcriptional regulator